MRSDRVESEALALLDALFGEQEGWLALFSGARDDAGKLVSPRTEYLRWPDDRETVSAKVEAINGAAREGWFCAHLLREPKRNKANALPLAALYADLDGVPVPNGALTPSAVIESSSGRWQVFWRLSEPIAPEVGEALNKQLAEVIGADPSGADLSQILRLPGTRNHKYPGRPEVRLVTVDGPTVEAGAIRTALPESEERRQAAVPVVGDIREGERDTTLTSMAGSMRHRGFSEEAIYLALSQENRTRCAPPLPDEDVARIARSISRYEPGDTPRNPATPLQLSGIYTASELMLKTFTEPRWAVPGFVPEGLSALAGKPKMGKSWMALDFALGVALGRPVLGSVPVEQGDVMALFLEDGERRLQERIAQLLFHGVRLHVDGHLYRLTGLPGGRWPDPGRLNITNQWPKLNEGGLDGIEEWVEDHPRARLIIIDTLGKVKPPPGKGSAYDADTEALGPLQQMALRRGIAVLVLTHLRKEKIDDPLEMINASMGFAGALDGALILNRIRGNADATLYVTGRDVKEDKDHALSWNAEKARWTLSGDAAEARLSREQGQVLQVIREAGNPITGRAIAQILEKPEGTIRRLCAALVKEGHIEPGSGSTPGYTAAVRRANTTNNTNTMNTTNNTNNRRTGGNGE